MSDGQSVESGVTCPLCGSSAYVCNDTHTDGSGPTLHCRAASLHNFPIPPAGDHRVECDCGYVVEGLDAGRADRFARQHFDGVHEARVLPPATDQR